MRKIKRTLLTLLFAAMIVYIGVGIFIKPDDSKGNGFGAISNPEYQETARQACDRYTLPHIYIPGSGCWIFDKDSGLWGQWYKYRVWG